MTQLRIDWDSYNRPHLERVSGKIANSVLAFCQVNLRNGGSCQFHMNHVVDWVQKWTGVAPDSPGRILRDLRQKGYIDYEVVNRRLSLYRLTRVAP